EQFMEQTEEKKGRRPLSHENAPLAFAYQEQCRGNENGSYGSPVPDCARHLVCNAKVLLLYVLCFVSSRINSCCHGMSILSSGKVHSKLPGLNPFQHYCSVNLHMKWGRTLT